MISDLITHDTETLNNFIVGKYAEYLEQTYSLEKNLPLY